MTMFQMISLRGVHLHCLDLQREVARERLAASLAAPPRWTLALRLRRLCNGQQWMMPCRRMSTLDAPQFVRWIVARP